VGREGGDKCTNAYPVLLQTLQFFLVSIFNTLVQVDLTLQKRVSSGGNFSVILEQGGGVQKERRRRVCRTSVLQTFGKHHKAFGLADKSTTAFNARFEFILTLNHKRRNCWNEYRHASLVGLHTLQLTFSRLDAVVKINLALHIGVSGRNSRFVVSFVVLWWHRQVSFVVQTFCISTETFCFVEDSRSRIHAELQIIVALENKWWDSWNKDRHAGLVLFQALEFALLAELNAIIQVNFALDVWVSIWYFAFVHGVERQSVQNIIIHFFRKAAGHKSEKSKN